MVGEKYSEFLRRGFILTKEHCPKCGKILLKDPETGLKFCIFCGYKETLEDYLEKYKFKLIKKLEEEKDIKNIYYILKSIYLIKKINKLLSK